MWIGERKKAGRNGGWEKTSRSRRERNEDGKEKRDGLRDGSRGYPRRIERFWGK